MVTISPKLHQPKKSYYPDAVDTTIKNKETIQYLSMGTYHVIPLNTNGIFGCLMTE
jgi:hypothetical protein